MPVWFRGRGGGWCESWSPPTMYSPGGKLVFCDMDSRKAGGCVPPNASLSWLINFVGFNIVVYSSVPGRAVCLSVSVPVWFRGRGGGWCSSLRPCYSPDVMGDAPWQDGCSEDEQASKIFYFPCYRLHGPRRLARWVQFRPVGFGWVSFPALRGREGKLT